jgi:hypothetical protein
MFYSILFIDINNLSKHNTKNLINQTEIKHLK